MAKDLLFFGTEGNSLNIVVNPFTGEYEGKLIFDHNSSDTFKTFGLYMFERINSFEYTDTPHLWLDKFQLFNEYGIDFYSNKNLLTQITKIEAVNNDNTFYSKWVYGNNFDALYPIGTMIRFDITIAEFNNTEQFYQVVNVKRNGILILSNVDNQTFNTLYQASLNLPATYVGKTISGGNLISLRNYVDSSLNPTFSDWSEPQFYTKLFNGQKLTIVNSSSNDAVVTLKDKNIVDHIFKKYRIDDTLYAGGELIFQLKLKTDLPLIYNGGLNFNGHRIDFLSNVPRYLKPGMQFQVLNSISNSNFLTVDSISDFNPLTQYVIGNQVIFNNITYQAIQNYATTNVNSVDPTDTNFWSTPTYVITVESLTLEFLVGGQLYLTTDSFFFTFPFTTDNDVTFVAAVEKYKNDFALFNITLKYTKAEKIVAYLNQSSSYAEVNFFDGTLTNNITITEQINTRNLEVYETLVTESNKNISSNIEELVQFTIIDDFGIKITINGQVYYTDVQFVYNGLDVDMEKTINETLKNWHQSYFIKLVTLGIVVDLHYFGPGSSIFFNTLRFRSVYPNVPISITTQVGSTANYRLPHSALSVLDMGGIFILKLNALTYLERFDTSIHNTLLNWKERYAENILFYGIEVEIEGDTIFFYIKDETTRISYTVSVGKSSLPGDDLYLIRNYKKGNNGLLIASNQITSSSLTASFDDAGFATGMLTNLSNSDHPLNNQEYNILYLEPDRMIFSYQGPFWGNTNSSSYGAYVAWAFDSTAFGYDPNATYSISSPIVPTFSVSSTLGTGYDIIYNSQDESMIISEDDFRWSEIDVDNIFTTYGLTTSLTFSSTLKSNRSNGLQYVLYTSTSSDQVWTLDTLANKLILLASYSSINAYEINQTNGDCYIAQGSQIDIYDTSGTLLTPIGVSSNFLVYSESEDNIYSSDGSTIKQISGTTRLVTSTITQTVLSDFYYNPITDKVYFGDTNLYSLQNGVATSIPSVAGSPDNYDIDPYIDQMYVSSAGIIYVLDINDSIINQYNTTIAGGELRFNHFDRNIYYFTDPNLLIINNASASIVGTLSIAGSVSSSAYNFSRNSIYGIYASGSGVFEVITNAPFSGFSQSAIVTYSVASNNYFGNLAPEFFIPEDLTLKTREFIRKPRYGFQSKDDNQVSYKWEWEQDNVPEISIVDFTGDQLATTGSYVYTGIKPLDEVRINREPNKDISKISLAKYQQTVFNAVTTKLDYIDSTTDISFVPEPITLFLGFNSENEGVVSSTLLLKEVEDIQFSIVGSPTNSNILTFTHVQDDVNNDIYAKVDFDPNSTDIFLDRNLKVGQIIQILIKDITNTKREYMSPNNAKTFLVRSIGVRELILNYLDTNIVVSETNKVTDYPTTGVTTYPQVTFVVQEKEIGRVVVYGQTEIEDIRYKIELNNVGHNLYPEDAFIFKEYPIDEEGIDWSYLNKKRKEMLLVKGEIFNYVGSYKAIINAINLFGYNDLELYEYYRNINMTSSQFGKLFKVEIPDIFDNSVDGFTDNDYFKNTYNNASYEVTNLFNLTYKITDKEGNFLFAYSTNEVVTKLAGLKKWLTKNVVPITHKILDITGRADFVDSTYIFHDFYDITILNQRSGLTPVTAFINEAYVLPVNSGSTVYNVVIDPSYQTASSSTLPDNYQILVKTYQTYPTWSPFQIYDLDQYVRYLDDLYVSVLTANRLNSPIKYKNTAEWSANNSYTYGQIVAYQDRFYRYLVLNPQPSYQLEVLSVGTTPNSLISSNSKTFVSIEGEYKVTIIDNVNFTTLTASVSVGTAPTKILKNSQNGYLYVMTTGSVDIIDPSTNALVNSIVTGINIPIDIEINNNSGKLYLSLSNNDVEVYDQLFNLLTTITFTNPITNLTWANSLDRIYGYDAVGTKIIIINSLTDLVLLSITTSVGSKMLFNNVDGFLYFIDGSNHLYRTINAPFTFPVYTLQNVTDFLISDSGIIYISNGIDAIVTIDTTLTITNTFNVNVNGIMTIDSFNGDIYISDATSNVLVIYSYKNNVIKATLILNDSSTAMIFDNSRNTVYGVISTTNDVFSIALRNQSDPPFNNKDWSDVTEWEKVPFKPVQRLKEMRTITDLTPYNFTVDSNIDPYVVVEVTSDNGYGQIYTDRKNYELYISEDGTSKIISTDPVVDSNP